MQQRKAVVMGIEEGIVRKLKEEGDKRNSEASI
jgi:hypothetical protein